MWREGVMWLNVPKVMQMLGAVTQGGVLAVYCSVMWSLAELRPQGETRRSGASSHVGPVMLHMT